MISRAEALMGTVVKMDVAASGDAADDAIERAFCWFHEVEAHCSRFDPGSELRRLCAQTGAAVPVSPILFELVRLALAAAETTGGAFDPTIGRLMETRGFCRHYASGELAASGEFAEGTSWRDVEVDAAARTIRLRRALTLDLGAVAKGFAIDLAARELSPFRDFAIDAGGDLYLGGCNHGNPWRVGIAHPRIPCERIAEFPVSNRAVCTSGDYERRRPDGEHHILDPRTQTSPHAVASVTVIAPQAVLADTLATAAFILDPRQGIELLETQCVEGLIVTADLLQFRTRSLQHAA